MCPSNKNRGGDSHLEIFKNITEEEKYLARYKMEAMMYLIKNREDIKYNYACDVYKQLCLQDPEITNHVRGVVSQNKGVAHAWRLISSYTVLCDDMLVLCHPESREPCVVTDVYGYIKHNLISVEEQVLNEYIQTNPANTYLRSEITKKVMTVGVKFGTGYGLTIAGNHLVKTSERLNTLSSHYASGHSSTMRMQRSVRGKIAQREALMKMFRKSAEYGTSASRSRAAGSLIAWMSKKLVKDSFRPIGISSALEPQSVALSTLDAGEFERIEPLIIKELKNYCNTNNNYHFIINQQFFNQR